MTPDDATDLARRVADALVQLLPTAAWDAELAGLVAQLLGNGDQQRTAALAGWLRDAGNLLEQADPAQRDEAEEHAYTEWRDWLARILIEEPALAVPVRRVHQMLIRAAIGVSGRSSGDPAVPPADALETDARQRRLLCVCPDSVRADEDFGVVVRIIVERGTSDGVPLKSFPVPPEGREVLLDIQAPGLLVRGPRQQRVRVPQDADSEPVHFGLRAKRPGPARISVTAWVDGNFVGEAVLDVIALQQLRENETREFFSPGLSTELADGAVSLVVRYEPRENRYRFQFIDVDNPREVLAPLSWPLDGQIEALIGRLESMRSRGAVSRVRIADEGAELWRGILPEQVRRQFWERRDRIKQLRILGEEDHVPWELMYPADQGHDAGFLVEQFPVTRDVFDRHGLARRLKHSPARFVLPPDSPPMAYKEVDDLRSILQAGPADRTVITEFVALRELINEGGFGLLHFACHNSFSPADGSVIATDGAPFTIANLQTARNKMSLAPSGPLVFVNACRSAGVAPWYNELAGWAEGFLRAGAGAFIGSLWAVRDMRAYTFATTLYPLLQQGRPLGEAVMSAREEIAGRRGDPTWLAYAVYGDPLARMTT